MEFKQETVCEEEDLLKMKHLLDVAYKNSHGFDDLIERSLVIISRITGTKNLSCRIGEKEIKLCPEECHNDLFKEEQNTNSLQPSLAGEADYKDQWRSRQSHSRTPDPIESGMKIVSKPIVYAGMQIGILELKIEESCQVDCSWTEMLSTVSTYLAHCFQRGIAAKWSYDRFGRSFPIVGMSKAICEVDHKIEYASQSRLPVLVQGEYGTEQLNVAMAIHSGSSHQANPFIEVNCTNICRPLENFFSEAQSGSICLSNIHRLSTQKQLELTSLIFSHLGQWTCDSRINDVRILTTTHSDLWRMAQRGEFMPELLAELSILSINIPPLRDRDNDIAIIINDLMRCLRTSEEQVLDEEAMKILCSYTWPGNLYECRQLLSSILAFSSKARVSAEDLLNHAPWLCSKQEEQDSNRSKLYLSKTINPRSRPLELWLNKFLTKSRGSELTLHEGLYRAVIYILENYADSISLGDLARIAHVSPSYLSFLFRKEVKASFKEVQRSIRIQKAKELLGDEALLSISEIAARVGYSDLSYFERSFRGHVGMRPRDYRRALK